MIENGNRFDFEGIMVSGIIVGALGACMDVGMSIASSINEISENVKNPIFFLNFNICNYLIII